MTDRDPAEFIPLPVSQLHILMALATEGKHGYAIMKDIQSFTDGAVTMGPGTLYGAVKQMLKARLIEESDERPDPELDDQRRRYYRLTDLGSRVLDAEVVRMDHLTCTARTRHASTIRKQGV